MLGKSYNNSKCTKQFWVRLLLAVQLDFQTHKRQLVECMKRANLKILIRFYGVPTIVAYSIPNTVYIYIYIAYLILNTVYTYMYIAYSIPNTVYIYKYIYIYIAYSIPNTVYIYIYIYINSIWY